MNAPTHEVTASSRVSAAEDEPVVISAMLELEPPDVHQADNPTSEWNQFSPRVAVGAHLTLQRFPAKGLTTRLKHVLSRPCGVAGASPSATN